jgi:hypothetical protein
MVEVSLRVSVPPDSVVQKEKIPAEVKPLLNPLVAYWPPPKRILLSGPPPPNALLKPFGSTQNEKVKAAGRLVGKVTAAPPL